MADSPRFPDVVVGESVLRQQGMDVLRMTSYLMRVGGVHPDTISEFEDEAWAAESYDELVAVVHRWVKVE